MSIAEDAAIETLAEAVGIELSYCDTVGRIQHVSIETKHAMLLSMGFSVSSADAVREALQALVEAEWHRLIAPATVLRRAPDTIPSVTLTLPEASLSRPLDWHLDLEAGTAHSGTLEAGSLAQLERRAVSGSTFVRVCLPLPTDMDDGYHKLTVAAARMEATATIISAPPTAFVPDWLERGERRWGIACPLFSIWSAASWGIGDFSDLAGFARIGESWAHL